MSRGGLRLLAGLGLSALLHGGMALGLTLMLTPDPIPEQPRPKSTLRIETEEVAQSRPKAESTQGEAAAPGQEPTTRMASGAVRQDRATAAAPDATRLAARPATSLLPLGAAQPAAVPLEARPQPAAIRPQAAPAVVGKALPAASPPAPALPIARTKTTAQPVTAAAVPAAAVTASAVTAALLPATQSLPARAAPAAPLAPALSVASDVSASRIAGAELPAATNAAVALGTTAPAGQRTQASAPEATAIGQSPALGAELSQAEPEVLRASAELAFSGEANSALGAQSLAAIQAFMQPGDAQAQASPTRDALAALLASVPCARLNAGFNPETGGIVLSGHMPEEALRAPLLAALANELGPDLALEDQVQILPRPQCGALTGIDNVGLPQSTEQFTDRRLLGAGTQVRSYAYGAGQRLELEVNGADYPAYFYIDYFAADGTVSHLIPNEIVPLSLTGVKGLLHVGRSLNGEPALDIRVQPPFGQEIVVAFAASAPLYQGVRPLQEPAGPYLDWLKDRVAEARDRDSAFKGEWVYFFVATHP